MSNRIVIAAAGVAAIALALVVIGRWEGRREARLENDRIHRTLVLVGTDVSKRLTSYRTAPSFTCLLYGDMSNPYRRELCLDPQGRVIEALDRSAGLRVGSVRYEPALARYRLDPRLVLETLRARAPKLFPASLHVLPTGPDVGPIPLPERGG